MSAVADDIAAIIRPLVGRWPVDAPGVDRRAPKADPLGAIAALVDAPATGTGPLTGLSVAIKDNVAVAGAPMALGSGLAGFTPTRDAVVVERVRSAGGRVVAKAQCEAFLLGTNSFTSRPFPVRNPHDPLVSAGGSSGGSAAMVAAGLVDVAVGTDSGGSIRIPAALCGVVGFKPTRGRIPYTGVAPLEPFLEHAGPIARDVTSATLLFDVMDGTDAVDPRTVWARHIAAIVSERPRLGVPQALFCLADPPVAKALRSALNALAEQGVELVTLEWDDHEEVIDLALALYLAGQSLAVAGLSVPPGFAATVPDGWADWRNGLADVDLPDLLLGSLAVGDALLASDPGLYARAIMRALALAETLDDRIASVDALILPTTTNVAPPIPPGIPTPDQVFGDNRLTAPFNVTGNPAISLPCGFVAGLPVALQLVGRRGADQALLTLAARIEPLLPPTPRPIGYFGDLE